VPALRPLQRPLLRHLGLSLLSLRRALRHVRLHHPPLLWAWTWASFRHLLLEAPLPDFDDVGVDNDDMVPEDEAVLLALTGGVPTQPTLTPVAPVHVPSRAVAVVPAASAPAQQPRGAAPVTAAAPVATRAPMAKPPHMARVTVGGVTVDPALRHMSSPDDEPMLDGVEVTEEEASALERATSGTSAWHWRRC
jgi:hypothetical protein